MILVCASIATSTDLVLATPTFSINKETLAPYSIADLISEHDRDLEKLAAPGPVGAEAFLASKAEGFAAAWTAKYAQGLAEKMVSRVASVRANGMLDISLEDARRDLISQIDTYALRRGMPREQKEHLVTALASAFETLRDPSAANGQNASVASHAGAVSQALALPAAAVTAIEWLTPEEATKRLDGLPTIGSIDTLEHFYAEAEARNISHEEFFRRLRPELAQMADILKRARPVDELNALVDANTLVFEGEDAADPALRDRQILRLDVLRGLSELILQLLPEQKSVDNLKHLKKIREVFAKYPEETTLLVKYFETRFDPARSLNERGESAGNIRLKLLSKLREMKTEEPEEHYIFEKACGILIATVKTDYFVEGRTSLFFAINPRAIVRDDEDGALVQTPPYAIIWVHVPYGAYGAHSRYVDVARGGLRMISPDRINMRDKILHECVALSITQHKKHTDIPEGGSKGTFVYEKGLNAVAAAIGYSDGLINCMMEHDRIAVSSGASAIDPLELGPDEGTAPLANLITARSWMKGLQTWRLLMTGKSHILGGVSHMENNLLNPPEKGNRVTSQGVMQHAFSMVRYLRDTGILTSREGEPIVFTVTGGLDGDVASGLVERSIDHYGDTVVLRAIVDASGVIFDPQGLNHQALMDMYRKKSQARQFPKDVLHKGGFVAVAQYGPADDNYIVLDSDSLAYMNTRSLDPEVLRQLDLEKNYKAQARLTDDEPLISVLERDAQGRPSKVRVHTAYLRDAMFLLVKSDMLLTGGGRSNSIDQNNWPLFFDGDGRPVSAAITHGANVFMHKEAILHLEKKGVVIEPDEKANSVGVEISSKMEIDFSSIYRMDEETPALMSAYFEQVLAKCLENARAKFWALRIEAEDRPGESVVTKISPAMSAEIIRLSEHILKSDLIGYRKSDYDAGILDALKSYFPDVSGIDKAYPSTLDRVFDRMPTERIKAIAAKLIAKEIVLNLGVGAVPALARRGGVGDIEILRMYLTASRKMFSNDMVKETIDNAQGLRPQTQIEKLRLLRQTLKHAIVVALASNENIISDVGQLTSQMDKHCYLRLEGPVELSKMVIVMKKGLPEAATGDRGMSGARGSILRDQYQLMRQKTRKMFAAGQGLVEVDTQEDLIRQANALIAQGMKVIVLDDGTLTDGLRPGALQGKAGESYCVVSSDAINTDNDETIIPFVNLNAMAMMGVGVLYDDLSLFELAYRTFTGKDVTEDLIAHLANKVLWIVRALPRAVRVTDDVEHQQQLRKLFEVSA